MKAIIIQPVAPQLEFFQGEEGEIAIGMKIEKSLALLFRFRL